MSMKDTLPMIGITLGDAAGIGAEIVCLAAAAGSLSARALPLIIGQEELLLRGMRHAGVSFPYQKVASPAQARELKGALALLPYGALDAQSIRMGVGTTENGRAQGEAVLHCIRLCQAGELDGFCFAPLNKGAMKAAGYDYPSEHEMFAAAYGQSSGYGEANYMGGLWNVRVSSHIPFSQICAHLTKDNILATARLGMRILRQTGCQAPKIALAALNPHAGENGTCGREELDILMPAIALARREGIPLDGPFPADTLFARLFKEKYHLVVTLYHDQGQIAIKLQNFLHCVTVSAGLPHPITTPAHGTAYDIAGAGLCSATPFEEAYDLCCTMAVGSRDL
ncbi:MAG: PdxA family protein [Christensenellales bacterium]